MNTPSRTLIPLLALGAVLSGCSCGRSRPESAKSVLLPSASPSGTFVSPYKEDPLVKCDAKGNCTITFKDAVDSLVTWNVDFTLDSVGQSKDQIWREL